MRLPYISTPLVGLSTSQEQIVERVLARRRPRGLLALDLTLLHSPLITDGWHSFFGALRSHTVLRPDIRALAICRVALLNKAWYQWEGHSAALLACEGFGGDKMDVVKTLQPLSRGPLEVGQWAALQYADAMTRDVTVDDAVFEGLKRARFTDQEIVELTATVAGYNCVSRFLVAMDVGEKNRPDTQM